MSTYKYPKDIIEPLKAEWYEWHRHEDDPPELPSDDQLQLMLEVAYHASFTVDEQRKTRFRLVFCDEEQASRPLRIAPPRDLVSHEIMRLAPVILYGPGSGTWCVNMTTRSTRILGVMGSAHMKRLRRRCAH